MYDYAFYLVSIFSLKRFSKIVESTTQLLQPLVADHVTALVTNHVMALVVDQIGARYFPNTF
jgi:hypothetical protein